MHFIFMEHDFFPNIMKDCYLKLSIITHFLFKLRVFEWQTGSSQTIAVEMTNLFTCFEEINVVYKA